MQQTFDAIVIGAGQSGPFLAVRLARAGRRVVLIEREHLGGTCVNDGCIPTKTLVASARVAHVARGAAAFGVQVGGAVTVDMAAVKARKDAVVNESVAGLAQWFGATAGLTLVRGEARFTGPASVRVGADDYTAPQIFLDTGGSPVVPDWPGVHTVPYLTNTTMMAVDFLPAHLVIVGGSYIGLEFAQMYRRFGSAVTVLEASGRLIGREDPEVSAAVHDLLAGEGVEIRLGAKEIAVQARDGGVQVDFAVDGAPVSVTGSHLLVAVGRRPNVAALDLDRAGVALDARGYIAVDDRLATSVPGIWALGDVNGRGAFTHTSYNDFEIVAANLLDGGDRRVSDRIPAYALYTDPPLGRIGMNEAEVRARGRPARVATFPMSRVGRARERGETTGFMKVHVDAETERLLGAALFGIEADEVVQTLLLAMAADLPFSRITHTMFIHPTVTELLPSLFQALEPLT